MLRSALAVAFAVVAVGPAPYHRHQGGGVAASVKDCIQSWPEARYRGLGFNHIVHLRNSCDEHAECTVTTNVAPQPASVTVSPRSEVEVITFVGSPAREFTPAVECRMVP